MMATRRTGRFDLRAAGVIVTLILSGMIPARPPPARRGEKSREVGRFGRFNQNSAVRQRIGEFKGVGVEQEAGNAFERSPQPGVSDSPPPRTAIQIVADDRMPFGGEMDAGLVGTTGRGREL